MAKRDRQTESPTVADREEQAPTLTTESEDPVVDETNASGDEPPAPPVEEPPAEEPPVVEEQQDEFFEAPPVLEDSAPASPYAIGDIIHTSVGRAKVLSISGDHMDVRILRTGTCKSIRVS